MTSAPARDPLSDHLLTPGNAAFLVIDYQPAQLAAVRSMDHDLLLKNAVATVRTIKTFGVPSTRSAKGLRFTPSSTPSAAPRPRPTAPALTASSRSAGSRSAGVCIACELQRDWARQDTVPAIVEIVLTDRLLKEQ